MTANNIEYTWPDSSHVLLLMFHIDYVHVLYHLRDIAR